MNEFHKFIVKSVQIYATECDKRFSPIQNNLDDECLESFFTKSTEELKEEPYMSDELLELKSMNVFNTLINDVNYRLTLKLKIVIDYDNPHTRFVYFFLNSYELKDENGKIIDTNFNLIGEINSDTVLGSY